jgi:hypothetical protein
MGIMIGRHYGDIEMTTFKANRNEGLYYYTFYIKNNTTTEINYDFGSLIEGRDIIKWVCGTKKGTIKATETAQTNFDVKGGLLIKDPVAILSVGIFEVQFRFWCGGTDFNIANAAIGTAKKAGSQALVGALGGAAGGAVTGSLAGGVGAIPGAATGAAVGAATGAAKGTFEGVMIGFGSEQYINFVSSSGFSVSRDTSEFNEIKGNGFRITVDGGGVKDPGTRDIYIQINNA